MRALPLRALRLMPWRALEGASSGACATRQRCVVWLHHQREKALERSRSTLAALCQRAGVTTALNASTCRARGTALPRTKSCSSEQHERLVVLSLIHI